MIPANSAMLPYLPATNFDSANWRQETQSVILVHHDLDAWLREYLDAAGEDGNMPLFRAADGKRKQLTAAGYRAHSMRQMMKRRLKDAGLPHLFSPHSFRVTVVTDLLNQNVPLEDVQCLAGHLNPGTTQIYDRRRWRVTRNIVERISIRGAERNDASGMTNITGAEWRCEAR